MSTKLDVSALDKFISSFHDYKINKSDTPISTQEIQSWLDGTDTFIDDLYENEVYDLYLDKFVDEYVKACH